MAKFLHIYVGDSLVHDIVIGRTRDDGDFKESDHPRDKSGEFTVGALTHAEAEKAHAALASASSVEEGKGHFNVPGKAEVSLTDLGMRPNPGGTIYGYTDKDLRKFRKVKIPIHELMRGQTTVHREHMSKVIEDMKTSAPDDGVTTNRFTAEPDVSKWKRELPTVVRANGNLIVQDGHHRLAAQLLAGRTHATVALIDNKDGEFYAPPEHKGKVPNLRTHDDAKELVRVQSWKIGKKS